MKRIFKLLFKGHKTKIEFCKINNSNCNSLKYYGRRNCAGCEHFIEK